SVMSDSWTPPSERLARVPLASRSRSVHQRSSLLRKYSSCSGFMNSSSSEGRYSGGSVTTMLASWLTPEGRLDPFFLGAGPRTMVAPAYSGGEPVRQEEQATRHATSTN